MCTLWFREFIIAILFTGLLEFFLTIFSGFQYILFAYLLEVSIAVGVVGTDGEEPVGVFLWVFQTSQISTASLCISLAGLEPYRKDRKSSRIGRGSGEK